MSHSKFLMAGTIAAMSAAMSIGGGGATYPRRMEGLPAGDTERARRKEKRAFHAPRLLAKAEAKRERRRQRNLANRPAA